MKKKVLLIAAVAAGVFATSNANAQDFKPTAGAKNIEVNFAPMGNSPVSINNLRLRYFSSSDMAFRLGFGLSLSSTSDEQTVTGASGEVTLESGTSEFGFQLNPGIEWHWGGTERLSPYYGAELLFATVSRSETAQGLNNAGTGTVEGETTSGETTFGLNGIIGADWYFTKNFYLGTEVKFGFAATSEADTETSNGGASSPTEGAPSTTTPGGSSFDLGPNLIGANGRIRLGFIF